jgi:hypothetical protein
MQKDYDMDNITNLIKKAYTNDNNGFYRLADLDDEQLENNSKDRENKRYVSGRIHAIYHLLKSLNEEYAKFSYEKKLSNNDKKIYHAFQQIVKAYEDSKNKNSSDVELQQSLLPYFRFLLKHKNHDYYPDSFSNYIFSMVIENLEKLASNLVIQTEMNF